jgi:hypothetical protein
MPHDERSIASQADRLFLLQLKASHLAAGHTGFDKETGQDDRT